MLIKFSPEPITIVFTIGVLVQYHLDAVHYRLKMLDACYCITLVPSCREYATRGQRRGCNTGFF